MHLSGVVLTFLNEVFTIPSHISQWHIFCNMETKGGAEADSLFIVL